MTEDIKPGQLYKLAENVGHAWVTSLPKERVALLREGESTGRAWSVGRLNKNDVIMIVHVLKNWPIGSQIPRDFCSVLSGGTLVWCFADSFVYDSVRLT